MGKIVLCTRNDDLKKMSDYYSDFSINANKVEKSFCLTVYDKLRINVENYYEDSENGSFIASTGTAIYKNMIGHNALKKMLDDCEDNSISSIRKNLVGSYCVMIWSWGGLEYL